jgi:hypothetical protein
LKETDDADESPESEFAALSLSSADTLSLINFSIFDHGLSQLVNDTIARQVHLKKNSTFRV